MRLLINYKHCELIERLSGPGALVPSAVSLVFTSACAVVIVNSSLRPRISRLHLCGSVWLEPICAHLNSSSSYSSSSPSSFFSFSSPYSSTSSINSSSVIALLPFWDICSFLSSSCCSTSLVCIKYLILIYPVIVRYWFGSESSTYSSSCSLDTLI